jgi:kynureninase
MDPDALDAVDPLRGFRERFVIDDPNLVYLDGNSLGRLPIKTRERINQVAGQEWAADLVRGWGKWFDLPQRLGGKIAEIIGAHPDEVIVCDSTTVNLYKLAHAAMRAQGGRNQVVTDALNFPSDLYALQGIVHGLGGQLELVASDDEISIDPSRIADRLNQRSALFTASHVSFKSGFMHDMGAVTETVHAKGALALWDLSHSVGVTPIRLNEWGVDLAIGCTYKYLNGGPGAPAFLFVRRGLQDRLQSPIWGWFGQTDPFAFGLDYAASCGVSRFMVGTPPILSLAAIEPGVDLILEAGIGAIREKSRSQTAYLVQLWEKHLASLGVALKSPPDATRRGSHVSFGHPEALRIAKALIEKMNVIPEFRAPDNLRFGISPLYATYREIHQGVERFAEVIRRRQYEEYSETRPSVT